MRMGDKVAARKHRFEGFRLAEVGMGPVKHQPLVETSHFGDVLVDDPDVVGHKYNRNPLLLVQFVEHLIEKPLGGGVDTGSGLVQKEQFRSVYDRSGNENPLLLPAGQAAYWPVPEGDHPDPLEGEADSPVLFLFPTPGRETAGKQGHGDALSGRRRIQSIDVGGLWGNIADP